MYEGLGQRSGPVSRKVIQYYILYRDVWKKNEISVKNFRFLSQEYGCHLTLKSTRGAVYHRLEDGFTFEVIFPQGNIVRSS